MAFEIKANDHEGAWLTYQDFKNSGGENLSAPLWLDLCRQLETQPDLERTAGEYQALRRPIQTGNKGCSLRWPLAASF